MMIEILINIEILVVVDKTFSYIYNQAKNEYNLNAPSATPTTITNI